MSTRPHNFYQAATALLVTTTLAASGLAAYFAGQRDALLGKAAGSRSAFSGESFPGFDLPVLEASSAVTSEKYSLATGSISDDADGLFVLDHNSGLLQCSVIYPRLGRFMAQFSTNVGEVLGSGGKGGKYMMVSGRADFPRSSSQPAASTVIYVMDTATGNYACFGVPFDRVSKNANRQQQNALVLITTGTANPVIDRDDLR